MKKIFQSSLKTALLTTLNLHRELLEIDGSSVEFCLKISNYKQQITNKTQISSIKLQILMT